MAQINIRMDDQLKEQADTLFQELGLNMSTAFNIFVRQSVREGGLPFEVTTKIDSFYSDENRAILAKSIQDALDGKLTAHELIEE